MTTLAFQRLLASLFYGINIEEIKQIEKPVQRIISDEVIYSYEAGELQLVGFKGDSFTYKGKEFVTLHATHRYAGSKLVEMASSYSTSVPVKKLKLFNLYA